MKGYELIENEIEESYFEVYIEGDCNDGDYASTLNTYDVNEFESSVLNELRFLNSCFWGRHKLENFASSYEDIFNKYKTIRLPRDYDSYAHTLVSLKVKYYDKDGQIYEVKLKPFTVEKIHCDDCYNETKFIVMENEAPCLYCEEESTCVSSAMDVPCTGVAKICTECGYAIIE